MNIVWKTAKMLPHHKTSGGFLGNIHTAGLIQDASQTSEVELED